MVNLEQSNTVLHATTIDVSGRGASIIGESGSGKSSLAIKLIALGADLVSDDQTLLELADDKIFLSKPRRVPCAIEARGIGLIAIPSIKKSELFCFVKLIDKPIERLPPLNDQICFGKSIRLIHFNPISGNEAALFLMIKYGLIDPIGHGDDSF